MNCDRAARLVSLQSDGRLPAQDEWRLQSHLAVCDACTEYARELACMKAALARAPRAEIGDEQAACLRRRVREATVGGRRGTFGLQHVFGLRVVGAAAVGAAAYVLASMTAGPIRTPSRIPTGATSSAVSDVGALAAQTVALSASDPLEDLSAANLSVRGEGDVDEGRSRL